MMTRSAVPSSTEKHSFILSIQNGRKHTLLLFNCGAGLIFENHSRVRHWWARILKPCDHVSDTSNNGHVATIWDDDNPLQHVYAIISFLHTSLKSLNWLQNISWDCLNFLINVCGNKALLSTYAMLLLIGFLDIVMTSMITEPIYLLPGPSRKHWFSVMKFDTVSTGFSFSGSSVFRRGFIISLTMEEVSQTFLTSTIHGKTPTKLLPNILLGEDSSKVICGSARSFNSY